MAGEDFVHVKLSAAGVALAAGGELRVIGSHSSHDWSFRADTSERVTRAFDWEQFLKLRVNEAGEPLFMLDEPTTQDANV